MSGRRVVAAVGEVGFGVATEAQMSPNQDLDQRQSPLHEGCDMTAWPLKGAVDSV